MESEKPARVRVPPWTWAFVAACMGIPLVALGGLIPTAIGAIGATACYAIAHDPDGKRTLRTRALLCLAVTALAWAAFGALAWAALSWAQSSNPSVRTSSSSRSSYRVVREKGEVVYDSRRPSEPKRPLSEVSETERRKIYTLTRRVSDAVDEKQEELDERDAEGGLTLRLKLDLEKLERKYEEHLAYVRDRFRLTDADLDALLAEGDAAGWGD